MTRELKEYEETPDKEAARYARCLKEEDSIPWLQLGWALIFGRKQVKEKLLAWAERFVP